MTWKIAIASFTLLTLSAAASALPSRSESLREMVEAIYFGRTPEIWKSRHFPKDSASYTLDEIKSFLAGPARNQVGLSKSSVLSNIRFSESLAHKELQQFREASRVSPLESFFTELSSAQEMFSQAILLLKFQGRILEQKNLPVYGATNVWNLNLTIENLVKELIDEGNRQLGLVPFKQNTKRMQTGFILAIRGSSVGNISAKADDFQLEIETLISSRFDGIRRAIVAKNPSINDQKCDLSLATMNEDKK